MSCNPLEMKDPDLPPTFSGYPVDDRRDWQAFREEYDRTHRELWEGFNEWMLEQGAPALPDLEFIHESRYLNLSVFPDATDYVRARPLGTTWHRLESSVRDTEEPWAVPSSLHGDGEDSLIYLSLGSLGSADVDLMRRLVDVSRGRRIGTWSPRVRAPTSSGCRATCGARRGSRRRASSPRWTS